MDSQDSTEVEWGSSRQPSISLKEWDIPIEDLKIGPKIGSGQFSTGTFDQTFIQASPLSLGSFSDILPSYIFTL